MCDEIRGMCEQWREHRNSPPIGICDWRDGESVLTDTLRAYVAAPGMALRDASCIICNAPLAGIPFVLSFLTTDEPCDVAGNHLINATVARHITCSRPDDGPFAAIIVAAVKPCYSG